MIFQIAELFKLALDDIFVQNIFLGMSLHRACPYFYSFFNMTNLPYMRKYIFGNALIRIADSALKSELRHAHSIGYALIEGICKSL
jgi:hypothetical protein